MKSNWLYCLLLSISLLLGFGSIGAQAATILVYHHVALDTPKSTTISPEQFKKHLDYLNDNQFTVVPLNQIVQSIKNQTPLADKTVAITFDDGYSDIYHNAHPLLKAYNFPYTLFINPAVVPKKTGRFLNWTDLKAMSEDGVMIANHGLEHESLIKVPKGQDAKTWVNEQLSKLEQAQTILKQQLNQDWRYFALPYGEYSQYALQRLAAMDFVVFTQQSGAVGIETQLTAVPRFPASQPYDKLKTLKTKLNSLPFKVSKASQLAESVLPANQTKLLNTQIEVEVKDFYSNMLQCFASGGIKTDMNWSAENIVEMRFDKPLKAGRTRVNCTAPSISKPGRYYWYSRPWFVPKADGSWYTW